MALPELPPRRRPIDPALLEPPTRQQMLLQRMKNRQTLNNIKFKEMQDKEMMKNIPMMTEEELLIRNVQNSDMPQIIIMPHERDEGSGPLVTLNIGGVEEGAADLSDTSAKLLLEAGKDKRMHSIMMQQLAR